MFRVTPDRNNRRVEFQLSHLNQINVRGIRQAFYQVGVIARRTIKDNIMKKPRFGKTYKFRGRRHRASVEGESFANRSGDAKATLGFDVRGAQELHFGFRENAKTTYTRILEERKNRPTLRIASRSTQGRAVTIMESELKKAHNEGYR
jgi:hypothetical protein